MPERHARLHAFLVIRFAEPPRVRELKADDEIIRLAVTLGVRLHQHFAQRRDTGLVFLCDDDLIRIRSTIRAHRHRLATVNQLRISSVTPPVVVPSQPSIG